MSNRTGILPLPGFPEAPKNGLQYARKDASWVQSTSGATISTDPPPEPLINGQLWYDSDSGDTYIWYDDGNSKQWVQQNLSQPPVVISDNPPTSAYHGQIWWDSNSGNTYIRFDDGNSQQWVQVNVGYGGAAALLSPVAYGAKGDGVVNDNVALQAVVAQALLTGQEIYWEAGTYLTTASIPNLHKVRHRGPGVIKRGTDLFYPCPSPTQTSKLYVAPTGGSATNDGLSSSQAMDRFQTAFDTLKNYGPVLQGTWHVVSAAGTYTGAAAINQLISTPSVNRVRIYGPAAAHPAVPTAIMDGTGGAAYEHGLRAIEGANVLIEAIKCQNYTTGNSRCGVVGENGADLYTRNVHCNNCDWVGIYAFNTKMARVSGGIIENCRYGAAGNMAELTVGYGSASRTDGTILKNNSLGAWWSHGTMGHLDYCTLDTNGVGLELAHASRCHTVQCDFKKNNIAVSTTAPGVWYSDGDVFNHGTADANVLLFDEHNGVVDQSIQDQVRGEVLRATTTGAITHTGTVAKTLLATPFTIPAYYFERSDARWRVVLRGFFGASASAGIIIHADFGTGLIPMTVPSAPTANAQFEITLKVRGQGRNVQRYWYRFDMHPSLSRISGGSLAANTTVDMPLAVSATLIATTDVLTINDIEVWKIG